MRKWILSLAVIMCVVLVVGCGGNGDTGESADSGSTEDTSLDNPEALGNAIADVYEEMYAELDETLNEGLSAEEVAPRVYEMKERYILQFVEFGRIRLEMTDEEKDVVDSALRSRFYDIDMDVVNSANDAGYNYREQDSELASQIVQMNILTQYADFELLRSQEPSEADRLGI